MKPIPKGWRRLKPGEIVKRGDKRDWKRGATGWTRTILSAADNATADCRWLNYIRRIRKGKVKR